MASPAIVMQQKTQRPVQFELTAPTREAVAAWIERARLRAGRLSVPEPRARLAAHRHARILESWLREIGLDPSVYGTHSMRRTKASLIYLRTKNHAPELAEQTKV